MNFAKRFTENAPPLVSAQTIENPIERNIGFNQWYHYIDLLLRTYMGTPEVPSWATFGKHASSSAGLQLVEVLDALDIVHSGNTLLDDLSDGVRMTREEISVLIGELMKVFSSIDGFLLHPQIIGNVTRLLRARSSDLNRKSIESSITHVRTALTNGNLEIYKFMAPNFLLFIDAIHDSPNGIPDRINLQGDEQGHLTQAFFHYARVRQYYLENDVGSTVERMRHAEIGNLLAVFNEQMNRVQPLYEEIRRELLVMSGTLQIFTPAGPFRLLPDFPEGNWANLYDRMGIDAERAPSDPATIEPQDLPSLLRNSDDQRFRGSIADFFQTIMNDPLLLQKMFGQPQVVKRGNLW